mgnify:FL=1
MKIKNLKNMNKKYQSIKILRSLVIVSLILSGFLLSHQVLAGTATLNWNASTDNIAVAGYKIYYGNSPRTGTDPKTCTLCGYSSSVNVGNVLTYAFNTLTDGLTYYFSITSYDTSNNESSFSSEVSKIIPVVADTTAPTIPANLAAAVISSSQINLSWTVSTDTVGVTGYKIYRGGVQIATSATNSYSNTGLTASTAYSYTVSAYDAAGNNSAQTLSVSATTQAVSSGSTSIFYSALGDGYVENGYIGGWATARDALSGNGVDYTSTSGLDTGSFFDPTDNYKIMRGFIPIDTSALPDNAVITSAALKIFVASKNNDDNDGDDFISVVGPTTQAFTALLSIADYNKISSQELATRIDVGNITTGAYNTLTLNSAGLSIINKTGVTMFGIREGHDLLNLSIDATTSSGYGGNRIIFYISQTAGIAQDPYLEVTYTIGGITDTAPPIISAGLPIGVLSSGATSAILSITTNENSTCKYGTTANTTYASIANIFAATGGIAHTQSLSGLTSGSSYSYYVRCQDSTGNTNTNDYSIIFSVPSADIVAPIITNITAGNITTNSSIIAFVTNELSDTQIEYGITTSYGQTTILNATFTTSHSQAFSNLLASTTYNYRIISKDAAGNIATSQNYTFTTQSIPDNTPPTGIIDFSISNIGQTSLTLSWSVPTDSSGISNYDIRYNTSPITDLNFDVSTQIFNIPIPATQGTTQTQYISVGLTPGTTYYFAIKSKDSSNNISILSNIPTTTTQSAPSTQSQTQSTQSGTVSVASSGGGGGGGGGYIVYQISDSIPPSTPANFKANPANTQVSLSWTNPSDSDFVRVKIIRKADSSPNSHKDGILVYEGANNIFTDINLINNQLYYYAIYAYDRIPNYSIPFILSAIPRFNISQTQTVAVSTIKQITPIAILTPQSYFKSDLYLGLKNNNEVKIIQKILNTENVYPENIISGNFGPLTQKAVIAFQKKYNISPASGVVGLKTRDKFNEVYGKTLAAVQTQPSTAIQTQIQPLIQTISAGTSKLIGPFAIYSSINSDQVKLLQSMLAKNKDIYPEGIITGYYGELTIKAVKRFQIKYNIEPIGIAGPKTRIKINEIFGQ